MCVQSTGGIIVRGDNEVARKPIPVVIYHMECPVVAAGVLCLGSATKRMRSDGAYALPSLLRQTRHEWSIVCESVCDMYWV